MFFSITRRALLPAALALPTLVTAPALAAETHAGKEAPRPVLRLVVADGITGQLTVHHAASGRRLADVLLPGPASSLVTLGDQRHVAAVVGTKDAVQLVDSGTWTEPHEDHTHTFLTTPQALGAPLAASRPSHVIAEHYDVVVFNDATGTADRYGLGALTAGRATPATIRGRFPHHGVAVPFGGGLLMSDAPAAAARPDAVVQLDARGGEVARFAGCPALHGEASGEDWAAFGCADGTLLVEGTKPAARKFAYPAATTARVSTWNRSRSGRHLAGAFGTTGVLIVDRRTGTQHLTALDGTVHAVKTDDAGAAIALTRDGKLHRIGLANGALRASAPVIDGFTAPSGQPAPKLSIALGRVAVSDPARGRVVIADARTLRTVATVRTGGTPNQVALTGAPAEAH